MTNEPVTTKVLIIGSGPAGYTTAIYAARANLEPVMVQGMPAGGQLMITTDVENYPGFPEIQGPELMEKMEEQARKNGVDLHTGMITDVDFDKRPFLATSDSGQTYKADTVVIATGAQARWLGLSSEKEFMGRGVSACATCDGPFFRNQDVAIVGGGNTAVEEALHLSKLCKSVTVIHRRDELRAEKILQDRLFEKEKEGKVKILWDTIAKDVLGDNSGVTGARLENVKTGEELTIDVTGFFVAIGHDPATAIFRGKLEMDDNGYIKTQKPHTDQLFSTATSVPGVFAAGDVIDKHFRQAVTAAGMGYAAAYEAEKFLEEHQADNNNRPSTQTLQDQDSQGKQHGLG